jgi:hypothetical protein
VVLSPEADIVKVPAAVELYEYADRSAGLSCTASATGPRYAECIEDRNPMDIVVSRMTSAR